MSRQVGDELGDLLAGAGVERHLLADVPAGPAGPQLAHQVDDPVQLVGLEGEHPLVVAQRERGDGVRPHVRVAASLHAVLLEHVAPLLVGQQVPLVGAHEGIDADVATRLLLGQERRDVAAVELGRAVQRHLRPDRLEVPAQRGAAEPGVGLLQRLRRLGVPPDHQVGVGPQTRDVVDPADDDVLAGQFLEQRRDLVRGGGPLVVAERAGQLEHRPHRVADEGVQLVRPLADAAFSGLLAHAPIVARAHPRAATARRASRMQAGTPTPAYAAPATPSPGTASTAARIAATRCGWPTRYCGSPSTHRTRWVCTGSGRSSSSSPATSATTAAVSSASSCRRAASSPNRPTDERTRSAPSRCGHLAEEAGTPLTSRPVTGGTSRPDPAATGCSGKAIATTAIDAYGMPCSGSTAPGATSASNRAVGPAGVASTTASAVSVSPSARSSSKPLPDRRS